MKLSEITAKTDQELTKLIADQRSELEQAVLDLHTKEVKNVKQLAKFKRTIARAMTIQRQRAIAKQEAAE